MIPGNPQILTCPYCGTEKEIMSLMSGNTFGAELWSDNKQIAPMRPEISLVQKCPHCGKYFIRTRQETRYAQSGMSMDQGLLTYAETKEAFDQISQEGFKSSDEEIRLRFMLHYAFNDFYYRSDEQREIDKDDWELFVQNGKWLIDNHIQNGLVKAEFYRQIGDFDNALSLLDTVGDNLKQFEMDIAKMIREHIDNKSTAVFRIR